VAGCDAAWMCERGIPTLIYGPGDIANAHSPNESVAVADLLQAAKVYALTALRFCG
jgi:acetylornithine deacetylase